MNKKLMFGLLGLFCIGMVAATIGYYAVFSTTLTVSPSITLSEECSDVIDGVFDGDTVRGDECVITNNAPSERILTITNDAPDEITMSYVGVLDLTKKDSEWLPTGDSIPIEYTIIGNEFEVTGVPEGYTAIYYKDAVVGLNGRIANPQSAISIIGVGNLPEVDDANWDELADYSQSPDFYNQHKGAKIWVVPNEDLIDSTLNWANMANYYYETDLIQYNSDGEIVLSPGATLTVIPIYEIGIGVSGEIIIETTIA